MKNRDTAAFAAPGIPGMTKLEYAAIQIFANTTLSAAGSVDAAVSLFDAIDEEAKKKK